MNKMEIVTQLCELVVFPLLVAISAYLVKLINCKAEEIKQKHNNEVLSKHIDILNDVISECVTATTQTYVDEMKKAGTFDEKASKKAFLITYNNVLSILNEKTKEYLTTVVGDLESLITQKIESQVSAHK